MEVFSTVIVEISEAISALFSAMESASYERLHNNNSSTQGFPSGHVCDGPEFTANRNARFLEKILKDLNVSVTVICENSNDSASSLKLCGSWSDICAVRKWLMHFIQTTESMQDEANSTKIECCTELPLDRPRCSSKNHCKAKQNHSADEVLLSSSKNIKPKQLGLQENNAQTKKCRVLSSNVSKVDAVKSEEMLEYYANCCITDRKANVSDIAAPSHIIMLNNEQFATENLVVENVESGTSISDELSETSIGLRQQLEEYAESNGSERKLMTRELKCDLCDYITRKQRNLLLHIARIHGNRSYVCPTCTRKFAIAKDLNHHIKSHTQQYCCELCGRTLKSKYAVALHVARIHRGLAPRPVKKYLCNLCGKMCRNKTDYTVHRNKEHTGLRPFHCDLCNSSFFSKANLCAHRQIHEDARMYECKQCGKAFKQRQGLRVHEAVHLAERRYKCDNCTKSFTQRSTLTRHQRTHTSIRPYSCPICPATFNDYSILRRHMLGIHKIQDSATLRQSVQAACAQVRLAEQSNAHQLLDTNTNSTTASNKKDISTSTTAASADILTRVQTQEDTHLNVSSGQLLSQLAVGLLSASSHNQTNPPTAIPDTLPHYFFIDAWRSVDSHHQKL